MKTQMHPVKSSQLSAIGYEDGTLVIRFLTGSTYTYQGVSEDMFQKFLAAESPGRFFREIKDRPDKYPYKKIN